MIIKAEGVLIDLDKIIFISCIGTQLEFRSEHMTERLEYGDFDRALSELEEIYSVWHFSGADDLTIQSFEQEESEALIGELREMLSNARAEIDRLRAQLAGVKTDARHICGST
jgi:DNA polymerase III delta prime subunit